MAEREDSKMSDFATTEEKCELGSTSDQDRNKPDQSGTSHNNRANHLENSSDVVVEADGLNEYSDELNVNVVAGSSNVSPRLSTMVGDQGIGLDSQTAGKSDVVDGEVRGALDGDETVISFGQFHCSISCGLMKHASSVVNGDMLQVSIAKSLDNKDAYNDDESRIVLETKGVEDMRDELDGCRKGNLVPTENEGIGDDGALFDKNVVAESSTVLPQPVSMVDEHDIDLDSQNKNLDFVDVKVSKPLNGAENGNVMRLDSHEEFPSLLRSNRGKITSDVPIMSLPEHSSRFNVNNEDESRIASKIRDVEDMVDQLDKTTGCCKENLFQTADQTRTCESKDTYVASLVACSVDVLDGEKVNTVAVTKPFNYLVKFPRPDDESLREQIRLEKLNLDEKTKLRNAIHVQIKEKRANNQSEYEFAKGKVRSARELVKSKNMEIDTLLSVINKAKIASSVEGINSQIRNMNYQIQHKTITLKEEKQLIHEIKHLKQLRQQLSSNMGNPDEIKQAVEQRDEAEDSLKILRKDLNILRNSVFKAEAVAAEAKKKYDDENQNVRELQAQCRAANGVCQASYAQLDKLRRELSKKSKHFFKYKDDAAIARDCAVRKNTEELYPLCMNQVERFMKLWNTNEEYRRDYARSNARSTLRRFGNLDGRGLGPDEKPPLLPNRMASTQLKVDVISSQIPNPELKQETKNGKGLDEKPPLLPNRMASTQLKVDVTSSQIPNPELKQETKNGEVRLDGKPVKKERKVKDEKVRKGASEAEAETLKKEEETRDKLKEERRMEETRKANEARERKKREAEKLQRRQEWKAQKEAEERDKVKQKREKKQKKQKENKMAKMMMKNKDDDERGENGVLDIKEVKKDMPNKMRMCMWMWMWMWAPITTLFMLLLTLNM